MCPHLLLPEADDYTATALRNNLINSLMSLDSFLSFVFPHFDYGLLIPNVAGAWLTGVSV